MQQEILILPRDDEVSARQYNRRTPRFGYRIGTKLADFTVSQPILCDNSAAESLLENRFITRAGTNAAV